MHGSEYTKFFFLSKVINKLSLRICMEIINFLDIESYYESDNAIIKIHSHIVENILQHMDYDLENENHLF